MATETFTFETRKLSPKNIVKYPHLLSSGKRGKTNFKAKYNELKKIENFRMFLLKLVFSDKTINGY